MTEVKSDNISEKTMERFVLRIFSPLTATMYAKDDWGELEECSEEVFPAELCSYEMEILEQIAKECLPEEGDRGLAVYLDIPELEENIYSMKPTVEVWHGELWGVLEVESHNQLSEREIEAVKSTGKVRKVTGGERVLNSGESKLRKENCMLAFGTVEMNSFLPQRKV